MKAEELEKGKKLADESLTWHRSTMPFPDEYTEEAIPKLIKWLKQFAFPELERHNDTVTSGPEIKVIIPESLKVTPEKLGSVLQEAVVRATRKK